MGILSFLQSRVAKGIDNTPIGLMFQDDEGKARLAQNMFKRCLESRGQKLTELDRKSTRLNSSHH